MLTESTKRNLRRKSAWVDQVQMHLGLPMWSWVDISLTDLCNRSAGSPKACSFCPRFDPEFYPNQNLTMPTMLVRKIANELRELEYQGGVVFSGYGETLLYPHFEQVLSFFAHDIHCELVTNGDRLSAPLIRELADAGLSYFVVSMYDGPHQIEKFEKMFAEAGVQEFILRDRWHTEADDFGLKLTNRAGTVRVGNQDPIIGNHPCFYLTYQLTIDWNGDVLLCVQDWHKKVKFGNVGSQSLWEIWTSTAMHKRRMQLASGKREQSPCNLCNTDGTLHGYNHKNRWTGT